MDDAFAIRPDPSALMADAMNALAARLRAEVCFTQATRGDGRKPDFLGLFMDEAEADAVTAELAGLAKTGALAGREEIEARWEAVRETRRADRDGIWARMATAFCLSEIELDLIVLAAAPALDPRIGRVYGFLNDDMTRRHLTPALALRLLGSRHLDTVSLHRLLSPFAPLRRFALLDLEEARPFIERPLRINEQILTRLLGDEAVLDPLRERFWLLPVAQQVTPCLQPPAWVAGPEAGARILNAAEEAGWLVSLISLPGLEGAARVDAVRLGVREARLLRALPVVLKAGAPDGQIASVLSTGAVLVTETPSHWLEAGLQAAPAPGMTGGRDQSGWLDTLFADDPRAGAVRAADHVALLDLIALACRHREPAALAMQLDAGRASPFGPLARLNRPTVTLDDMVLGARTRTALQDFIAQQRSADLVLGEWGLGAGFGKNQGAAALFRGPPGTGKTMAASAVASALDRPLVRIDLSGLVSKYIGETEKNLERVFTAAETSGALLFFDEADALFGRRSDVSDAHDRYANLETSYLLQRLECFSGVAVLASNLHQNIDDAFLRRLDQIVDFPAPTRAERFALWRRIETTKAPLAEDVDLKMLADRFELTGGEIRNCWLDAAHRAARMGGPITLAHLIEAVGRELIKQGRPIRKTEFGDHFALVRAGGLS